MYAAVMSVVFFMLFVLCWLIAGVIITGLLERYWIHVPEEKYMLKNDQVRFFLVVFWPFPFIVLVGAVASWLVRKISGG